MSRRSLGFLVGAAILAVLALKAPDILVAGLGYAWWMARRSPAEVRVQDVARAAMLGGVIARVLIVTCVLVVLPLATSSSSFRLPSFLLVEAASMTGFAILVIGTVSLVEAFLLGISVRLLSPWLPH